MLLTFNEHPPQSTNVIFVVSLKVHTKTSAVRVVKQFATAYGPQCIIWILIVNMPHFIEFARVSTTEYDEIVPMFKLRAFFRGESNDYFRFVQSPFYAMSATAKVRTRPVVFVNDINDGLEQLFESNRSTVSMEFGLEFHFSTDSLSRIRFANDAIRLFDFDAETTSVTSSLMQRFQQADNSETFVVNAIDGHKILPFSLLPTISLHFSQHFTNDNSPRAISIPFRMKIFELILSTLIFNENNFEMYTTEELQKTVECLHFMNPQQSLEAKTKRIIDEIGKQLTITLLDNWQDKSLEELMEELNKAMKCNLTQLVLIILNIVIDWHYAEFRRSYELEQTDERIQFLERIQNVEMWLYGERIDRHLELGRTIRRLKQIRYTTRRIFDLNEQQINAVF